MIPHVLVMAKAPVAGRVKTRLCPPCTPEEAAAIADAALRDTLDAVMESRAPRKIVALDGAPGPWLPRGIEVIAQRGTGLAERLANAWSDAGGWGVQIGMDTPQVRADDLDALLDALSTRNGAATTIGLAEDGGWWGIGLRGVNPQRVFVGIPTSLPTTGVQQLRRLRRLSASVVVQPSMRDIDTWADLQAVAATIPTSRTAAVLHARGAA